MYARYNKSLPIVSIICNKLYDTWTMSIPISNYFMFTIYSTNEKKPQKYVRRQCQIPVQYLSIECFNIEYLYSYWCQFLWNILCNVAVKPLSLYILYTPWVSDMKHTRNSHAYYFNYVWFHPFKKNQNRNYLQFQNTCLWPEAYFFCNITLWLW